MTTLDLIGVKFEETLNPTEAALNLSASIAGNSSLEALDCRLSDSFYRDAIFRGLAEHPKIKTLTLQGLRHFIAEELEGLQLALTAKTLVHLVFYSCIFAENWFSLILRRIREIQSVHQISFRRLHTGCGLDSSAARAVYNSVRQAVLVLLLSRF